MMESYSLLSRLLFLVVVVVALVAGYRWRHSQKGANNEHPQHPAGPLVVLPQTNQPPSVPINNQGPRQKEMVYTKNYLTKHFGSQFVALYLFGSRARGTGRPDSDHDFMVLVTDAVSTTMETGGADWSDFICKLNADRITHGMGAIDLLIKRKTSFDASNEGFSLAVKTEGLLVK